MRFRSLRDEGGGLVFLHLGQHAFNDILLARIRAKVAHDGADLLLDHTPLLLLRREQSVSVRVVQQSKQPERTLSKRSNAALILFFFSVISLAISSAIVVRPDVAVAVALIV